MCILHIAYFTELIIILFFSMNLLQTELNLHRTDAQGLRAWGSLNIASISYSKDTCMNSFD